MALYDAVGALPVSVAEYDLEAHELEVSPVFTRRTTTVRLHGPEGRTGRGEDVNYGAEEQARFQADGPRLDLAGDWTLETLSRRLDELELFTAEPDQEAYRDYRRWAFESAALDLALRQAERSLADVVQRRPHPVTFVSSQGLGSPPSAAPVRELLARVPGLRLKLDASDAWDERLAGELASTGAIATVDLKGAYHGTIVDQPPSVELYALVLSAFPEAWIEDPGRTAATDPLLEGHWPRVTWDAPIHSVDDVLALDHAPRMLNVKPSRFGPLRRLFDFYDFCAARGIELYGGGQFELAEGRRQVQLLASLFHPNGPNDVAPDEYHRAAEAEDLPASPLPLDAFGAERVGFGATEDAPAGP